MSKYVGLTTYPGHESGNVGDKLITEAGIDILRAVKGEVDVDLYFRREDFSSRVEMLNESDAIVLFGFPLKERETIPDLYRFAENLHDIEAPIIPLGTAMSFFPGNETVRDRIRLEGRTKVLLDRIVGDSPTGHVSARTEWVASILRRHDYPAVMTGDMAWYDPRWLGKSMHKPQVINRLVFTPPHRPIYANQARRMLTVLSRRFEEAKRVISFQSSLTELDRDLRSFGAELGWEIVYTSHDTKKLSVYGESDLHVGYRKHGHLAHLRLRRPSIVIAEDSRSAGLIETLGGSGVRGFRPRAEGRIGGGLWRANKAGRRILDSLIGRGDSGGFLTDGLLAYADGDVPEKVVGIIEGEMENGWETYERIAQYIDDTFEGALKPFVEALPDGSESQEGSESGGSMG